MNAIGWAAADEKHGFQWREAIVFSPHDQKTLYFAGEVLFKTTEAAMSWSIISPDLTRNGKQKQQASVGPIAKHNTGFQLYDTAFSLVESPAQRSLISARTDGGLGLLMRDAREQW